MQITTKGGKKGIPEVFQRWNNKNICYFYDIITYMVICQLSKMCNFWNVICFPSLRKLLPKFALIVLCPGSAPVLEFHPSPSPGPHGRRLNKARAVRTQPDMTKPWTPGQSEFCFPETTGAEEWAFISVDGFATHGRHNPSWVSLHLWTPSPLKSGHWP